MGRKGWNKLRPPSFEFGGKVYVFAELTVRQMELLSDMLHESRKVVWDEFQKNTEGGPQAIINFSITLSDLLHELRRQKKIAEFVAICMTQKEHEWQEQELSKRAKEFAGLPYAVSERVFAFFFNGGIFMKLIMPEFLTKKEEASPPGTIT